MKKLFALMLALCLLCGVAAAETVDFAPLVAALQENGINGEMTRLENIGLQVYLPEGLVEDPDATADEGAELLYAWKAADGSGDFIKVCAAPTTFTSTEEMLNALLEAGKSDAKIVDLPCGWQVVVATDAEDNSVGAGLLYEDGTVVSFDMGPVAGQEEAAAYAFGLVIATLSPLE